MVLARMRWDARTRAYIERRVCEGKTRREAIRLLDIHRGIKLAVRFEAAVLIAAIHQWL